MDIEIKANVKELILHLERNRDDHAADYEKAVTVYRVELKEAIANLARNAESESFLGHQYSILLSKPELKAKEYNKHIGMLEMSVEETITIDSNEYDCIVNDNWHWIGSAKLTNSLYSSKFG